MWCHSIRVMVIYEKCSPIAFAFLADKAGNRVLALGGHYGCIIC